MNDHSMLSPRVCTYATCSTTSHAFNSNTNPSVCFNYQHVFIDRTTPSQYSERIQRIKASNRDNAAGCKSLVREKIPCSKGKQLSGKPVDSCKSCGYVACDMKRKKKVPKGRSQNRETVTSSTSNTTKERT